jgi:hypothetical protein
MDGEGSMRERLTGCISPSSFEHTQQGVLVDLLLGWQRFRCPLKALILDGTRLDEKDLSFLAQVRPRWPAAKVYRLLIHFSFQQTIAEGAFPTLSTLLIDERWVVWSRA